MGTLLNRRRYMGGGGTSSYDEFGYIADGKVFHLDGISKGNNPDAWTDLVGGVVFNKVSGVTFENDCVSLDSDSSIFSGSSSVAIPYQTYTLEVAVKFTEVRSSFYQVAFHGGTSNSLVCVSLYKALTKTSPNRTTMAADVFKSNEPSTVSITNELVYYNGIEAVLSGNNNTNMGANVATVGSRGGSNPYKMSGKIYSVRVYNRLLSADEMIHNQQVDNTRFNLGLSL